MVIGICFFVTLSCLINHYLDLGILGRFGKDALIFSFVISAIALRYVGPTLREIEEYRDKKNRGKT